MKENEKARLILPVRIQYLPAAQSFIRELAGTAGLPEKDVDSLQLAVEEAITNVVEHAFLPGEDAAFEIICEASPVWFTVRIRDKGLPFDPRQVKQPGSGPDSDDVAGPGLGLRLMKRFVDRLALNNLGREGKEMVLTKFLQRQHVTGLFPPERLEGYDEPLPEKEPPRKKIPYGIQLLQPDQAIEVAQCAYRTYGYTYVMENVYYPDRLVEMTRTGELVSAVAVSEADQEVMAHLALEFQGRKHGIPESGMGFTKPEYRGQGCLSALIAFTLAYAREKGIRGIYSKTVTTHVFSQLASNKLGFQPCGLLVGHSPAKRFAAMERQGAQRETLVLNYQRTAETEPVRITMPPSHRGFIEHVFGRLGVPAVSAQEGEGERAELADGLSQMECDVNYMLQLAKITIDRCGNDLERKLRLAIKELCQKRIEYIVIYINMTDPGVTRATRFLEQQDCFIAGVFPAFPRPYLILQYLNHVAIDYDQMEIAGASAREIVDYVKAHDPNLDDVVAPGELQ